MKPKMLRYHYRLFGKRVASAIRLGALPQLGPGPAAITLSPARPSEWPASVSWYHTISDADQKRTLSFGKAGDHFCIRVHGRADFIIKSSGDSIFYLARGQTTAREVVTLFLGHALPLAINLNGTEVLHAGAISTPSGAIAFAGRSGAGKSTLVSGLVRGGFRLVTDDALAVSLRRGSLYVQPSLPEVRLCGTKSGPKRRLVLEENFLGHPVQLARVYILDPIGKTRKLRSEDVPKNKRLRALLENSMRLDLFDPQRMRRELRVLSKLIDSVPVYRLSFPKRWSVIEEIAELISTETRIELGESRG